MKRGGQEIYVGPLGHQSSHLIKYFEVWFCYTENFSFYFILSSLTLMFNSWFLLDKNEGNRRSLQDQGWL